MVIISAVRDLSTKGGIDRESFVLPFAGAGLDPYGGGVYRILARRCPLFPSVQPARSGQRSSRGEGGQLARRDSTSSRRRPGFSLHGAACSAVGAAAVANSLARDCCRRRACGAGIGLPLTLAVPGVAGRGGRTQPRSPCRRTLAVLLRCLRLTTRGGRCRLRRLKRSLCGSS